MADHEHTGLPELPKELAKQFGLLEQKFVRAEVDQSEFSFFFTFRFEAIFPRLFYPWFDE